MNQPVLKVTFNSTTEFIKELDQLPGPRRLLDDTLRVTNEYLPTRLSPNIRHVTVIATAVRLGDPLQIFELRRFCGDLWGIDNLQDNVTRDMISLSTINYQLSTK